MFWNLFFSDMEIIFVDFSAESKIIIGSENLVVEFF